MRRHFTILAIAAALLLFPSAGFGEPPAPDDQQLYANTVTTMRGLPEPPYLAFVTNATTKGLRSLVLKDDNGIGKVLIFSGNGEPSLGVELPVEGRHGFGRQRTTQPSALAFSALHTNMARRVRLVPLRN